MNNTTSNAMRCHVHLDLCFEDKNKIKIMDSEHFIQKNKSNMDNGMQPRLVLGILFLSLILFLPHHSDNPKLFRNLFAVQVPNLENGISEYGKWYLGIEDEEDENNKGHYKFPYGDFENVHRCGLLAAETHRPIDISL